MSRHELKECSDFYEKKCKTLLKNTRDLHNEKSCYVLIQKLTLSISYQNPKDFFC